MTFYEFVNIVSPRYEWYDYLEPIVALLQRVADDDVTRLMIFMPPRHGKTELVSRLFPAYYLYKYPERFVALASYGAELAHTLSRNARDNYRLIGGNLKEDAAAVKHWETQSGGGLWASGVGGAATGKGYNLGVIDDPVKDAQEASSLANQTHSNDWFDSVFWTRREPVNAVIIVQTRWGINDLSSYVLSKEDDEPEHWHVVHMEAIKTSVPFEYPESCTIEPDNRDVGEGLSPRYPLEKLKKIAKRIGSYFWEALYQQSPKQKKGRVYHQFSDDNIVSYDSIDFDNERASYYHGHDFGAVNRAWGLYHFLDGVYTKVFDELLPEGTTASRAERILTHLEGKRVVAGFGGAKSEQQQRGDYGDAGLYIEQPYISDVESQVDAVNEMFENGKLQICSDCTLTIHQLENCIRDEKGGIANKATWHHLDETRYIISSVAEAGGIDVLRM